MESLLPRWHPRPPPRRSQDGDTGRGVPHLGRKCRQQHRPAWKIRRDYTFGGSFAENVWRQIGDADRYLWRLEPRFNSLNSVAGSGGPPPFVTRRLRPIAVFNYAVDNRFRTPYSNIPHLLAFSGNFRAACSLRPTTMEISAGSSSYCPTLLSSSISWIPHPVKAWPRQ